MSTKTKKQPKPDAAFILGKLIEHSRSIAARHTAFADRLLMMDPAKVTVFDLVHLADVNGLGISFDIAPRTPRPPEKKSKAGAR